MKLGFIGTGKIAGAIVTGLCTSNIKELIINLSPRNEEKSKNLAKIYSNVYRMESNQFVLDNSDTVFISVLPDVSKDILSALKFKETHTVISLVPLLKFSELTEVVKPATKISRAVPLHTVAHHNCPIPVFNANKTVLELFSHIGQPFKVDNEDQLHVLWASTGFIGHYFKFLKVLSDWAVSRGAGETDVGMYFADMFYSLALSARQTERIDLEELVKHASTPGGLNEQAIREIDEKGIYEAYKSAADNLLERFKIDL